MRICAYNPFFFLHLSSLTSLYSFSLSLRASRECQNKERLLEQRFRAALRDFQQWLVNAKISTAKCFDVPQSVAEASTALQRIQVRDYFLTLIYSSISTSVQFLVYSENIGGLKLWSCGIFTLVFWQCTFLMWSCGNHTLFPANLTQFLFWFCCLKYSPSSPVL